MKLQSLIFLALCFTCSQASSAQDHALAVEQCIAENSGAESAECLQKIFRKNKRNIANLEKAILRELKQKRRADDLGDAHYRLAVSSLKDSSKKFAAFSEQQCDFATGASGAVASGGGQVRWSCLIRLGDWRIQYLRGILTQFSDASCRKG